MYSDYTQEKLFAQFELKRTSWYYLVPGNTDVRSTSTVYLRFYKNQLVFSNKDYQVGAII
jgi:hypothetical protein